MDASNLTADASTGASDFSNDVQQSEQRFILAGVDQFIIVFPSNVVADISIVDRSQILSLPFYDPVIWGIIHRSGQIVPLVSLRQIFGVSAGFMTERQRLTVVQLNPAMGGLAGVGLIVDTTLGTSSVQELPSDLFSAEMSTGSSKSNSKMRLFQPEMLGDRLWQPQRWQELAV
ncbi:MAG: chemotaxis protein CheW [Pseudanabaena sp. CRU_2_10]|nr:chemotaxis protein CheW [Pseudanabaena sp. CRU_2_10]